MDTLQAKMNACLEALKGNRVDEAIAHIEQALSLGAPARDLHYLHGLALALAGRIPEAFAALERELSGFPDNQEARALLDDIVSDVQSHVAAQAAARKPPALPDPGQLSLHQVVNTISYGDAIGSCMFHVRDLARSWGMCSHIFAEQGDPRLPLSEWEPLDAYAPFATKDSVLLYHPHNSGSRAAEVFRATPARKILYYHNFTPARFFSPWSRASAEDTERAIAEVAGLAQTVDGTISDSHFNQGDLLVMGFAPGDVLPLPFFSTQFRANESDERMEGLLRDGRTNIIFVGRIAPNKCQHQLLEAFDYYSKLATGSSRLLIVGSQPPGDPYALHVLRMAEERKIPEAYVWGHRTFAELVAIYKTASVFLCLSEHEGFCVPLLESMYFKVPIVAYNIPAIAETLGGAGMRVTSKDPRTIAEAIEKIRTDEAFRLSLVEQQTERLAYFSSELYASRLKGILSKLLPLPS